MQTVKVRLRKPNRVFMFLSNNIPVERNDVCIVRSDRGLEYGTCILSPEPCSDEDRQRYKMNVVRKATAHDERTVEQIKDDERRAATVFLEKIRERKLPMKLAEVEYTFDRRKATFYFTAEDRVDFRQLVRDLAQTLKARIELRHIQVRDEAKMVGGIGTCGRELCCSSWLQEFFPISMKMAKRQNLSLNPSKISGQCGRLMCCLAYENDQYEKTTKKRRPPKSAPDDTTLIQVRETMEANAPEAAAVLDKTASSDAPSSGGLGSEVAAVPRKAKPGRTRRRRGGRGQEQKKSTQQKTAGGPSSGGSAEGSGATGQPKRPKGKRRRRRGKRQGGGSGTQGAAPKKPGSS